MENEKAEKEEAISDLLVSAGYFRARLNISMFDKVLGGICWCVSGCNIDTDIEFQDDLNLA
jgi:hypothetical protein